MKQITLLLMLLIASYQLQSQNSNLIIFAEQGERFSVILNGIRQNANPQTNVKITDLTAPTYKVKILFEDSKLGEMDKTVYIERGTENTYNIKKNNKGEYVLRLMNTIPIAEAPPAPATQQVVTYTTVPAETTMTRTTTTVTTGDPQSGNVNLGINVNDQSMGINMNVNVTGDPNLMTTQQTTTTYTTTTTTTQGNTQYTEPPKVYVIPGYSGPYGCPWPISPQDFAAAKQSIASKSFDETRLTIAKQVISSNCLLCSQVKEIMMLFNFEETRLDLAKFAYRYTYDSGNYFKLNDAFTFESSIEELNEYIQGH